MLKHPSGPHTPSLLPSPRTPKPWGDPEFSDCQRSLTIWHPCCPGNIPLFVFEGSMPGAPLALHHRVWRKVRRGQDRAETSDLRNMPIPRATRLGGRDCSVPCVIVLLKDYLVLVFGLCVSPGQLHGGRDAGRVEGAPHFISKVLHLCDGVGWGGNHWCYGSGNAPPPP